MDAHKRFEKLDRDFFREWLKRHPFQGTQLGLHEEFDEKMPDGSLGAEEDDLRLLKHTLSECEKIDPKKLPPADAVQRDFLAHVLKGWIFDREELRLWELRPEAPTVIGQGIFQILSRNYAPLQHRVKAIMKRLEKMPKYIDASREKLRRPSKLHVEIELETITRLPAFFNLLKDIGREHMSAAVQRDLNRVIDATQNTLEKYSDWLIVDVLPDSHDRFEVGEELLRKFLHSRGADVTPGHLVSLAETEMERIREKQKEVARAIKRKVPIEDVRDLLKQQHSENIDGALRFARENLQRARQFVNRAKFAQLPEGEQVYVIETPSYLRHFHPFGSHCAPAPHEPKHDGYLYITPGDCDSDKLKEHNYGAVANLVVREGYPGRCLLSSWASRSPYPLRTIHQDEATAGGWGHYCEERVKEMGFDDTPPSRFMQLQSHLLACVRVVVDARIAMGKLGWSQAVEALIDHLGMDRICAEAEARRFVVQPGISLLHLWGRDRIRELRRWAKDRLESRFTETFFHTTLLKAGGLPPAILKRELEHHIVEELRKAAEEHAKAHGHDHGHGQGHGPAAPAKAAPARAKPRSEAPPKAKAKPKARAKKRR
jgi:uncharacterized protein (DUF885 family)